MGCRITEPDQVALYDSTTNEAFGPIFEDRMDAESFLDWLEDGEENNRSKDYLHDKLMFKRDARIYRDHELQYLHQLWLREKGRDE